MGKRFLDWLKPLPLWQKGCLGCAGCQGLMLVLAVLVAFGQMAIDPKGFQERQEQRQAVEQRERQQQEQRWAEDEKRRAAAEAKAAATAQEPKRLVSFQAGTKGVLRTGAEAIVIVALTSEAYNDYMKAASIQDKHGMVEVEIRGAMADVKSGTPVMVLDSDWKNAKVRVLEGPKVGQAYWVSRLFVMDK